jgi:hypothetical protein
VGQKPRFDRGSRRYSSSSCGFCTGDLLCAVTERPEDRVGFSVRRSTKIGIDIFPDISPSLVTSKKRPKEASLINVLPFGRR